MQAMDIANDALDKVLENIKTAFQLSIPVLSIVLIISAAFSFSFWLAVYSGNDSGVRAFMSAPLGMARAFAIPVLLIVIGVYWITVAWHRFVILEEKPAGILPKLHLGLSMAFGRPVICNRNRHWFTPCGPVKCCRGRWPNQYCRL